MRALKGIGISLLILFGISMSIWGINSLRGKQLFESLDKQSFCPKPFTVIEFTDSVNYRIFSGDDTLVLIREGGWSVKSNLLGVYLTFEGQSPWKLTSHTDNVVTFSKGEFEPKLVRFGDNMDELTEENWSSAR